MGLLECPVMVCMALWVNWRPTAPARPPERKEDWLTLFELPPILIEPPRKLEPPATFFAVVSPLAATISSAIMLPPVCPTLMPRLDKKLSIFWLIFKKAMAHKNQMNTFPAAVSFPTASTSLSVTAKTVMDWERNMVTNGTVQPLLLLLNS